MEFTDKDGKKAVVVHRSEMVVRGYLPFLSRALRWEFPIGSLCNHNSCKNEPQVILRNSSKIVKTTIRSESLTEKMVWARNVREAKSQNTLYFSYRNEKRIRKFKLRVGKRFKYL